jgi:hypothetical protein
MKFLLQDRVGPAPRDLEERVGGWVDIECMTPTGMHCSDDLSQSDRNADENPVQWCGRA